MGVLSKIAESFYGNVHFMVMMGNKPALEIFFHNKDIIVEVKNPILAVEVGLQEVMTHRRFDSALVDKIKSMGYTIKIKYKFLELDL